MDLLKESFLWLMILAVVGFYGAAAIAGLWGEFLAPDAAATSGQGPAKRALTAAGFVVLSVGWILLLVRATELAIAVLGGVLLGIHVSERRGKAAGKEQGPRP